MNRDDFLSQIISELSSQSVPSMRTDGSLLKQQNLSVNSIFKKFCFDYPDMTNADDELLRLSAGVASMDMKSILPQVSYFRLDSTLIQNILFYISNSKSKAGDSIYSLTQVLFFHVPVQMLDCNQSQLVHLLFPPASDPAATYSWKDIFDCLHQKVVSCIDVSMLSKKGVEETTSSPVGSDGNATNDLIMKNAVALVEVFTETGSDSRVVAWRDTRLDDPSLTLRDLVVSCSGAAAGDTVCACPPAWEGVREVLDNIRMKLLLFFRDVFCNYPEYLERYIGTVCGRIVALAVHLDDLPSSATDGKTDTVNVSFPNQMYCLYLLFVSNICAALSKTLKTTTGGNATVSSAHLYNFATFLTRDDFRHYSLLCRVCTRMSTYYCEVVAGTRSQLDTLQRNIDLCHEADGLGGGAGAEDDEDDEASLRSKAFIRQFRAQSTSCQQVYAGMEEVLAFSFQLSGVLRLCLQRLEVEHRRQQQGLGTARGGSVITPDVVITASGAETCSGSAAGNSGAAAGPTETVKKPKKKIGVKTASHLIGVGNFSVSSSLLCQCLYGSAAAGSDLMSRYSEHLFACLNFSVPKLNGDSAGDVITPAASSSALREYLEGYCGLLLSCHLREDENALRRQLAGVHRGMQDYLRSLTALAGEGAGKNGGAVSGYLAVVCLVLLHNRADLEGAGVVVDMCSRFVEVYLETSLRGLQADWALVSSAGSTGSTSTVAASGHSLKLKDIRYVPAHDLLFLLGAVTGTTLPEGGRFPNLLHLLLAPESQLASTASPPQLPSTGDDNTDGSSAAVSVPGAAPPTGVCWSEWCDLLLERIEAVMRRLSAHKSVCTKDEKSVAGSPSGVRKLNQIGQKPTPTASVSCRGGERDSDSSDSETEASTAGGKTKSDREKEEEAEELSNQVALMVKHYARMRAYAKQLKLLLLDFSSNSTPMTESDTAFSRGKKASVGSKMD